MKKKLTLSVVTSALSIGLFVWLTSPENNPKTLTTTPTSNVQTEDRKDTSPGPMTVTGGIRIEIASGADTIAPENDPRWQQACNEAKKQSEK